MSNLWNSFVEHLLGEEGKLDEFLSISDANIEQWLTENGFDASMDQIAQAAPKYELSDDDLEKVAGGKVTLHGLQDMLAQQFRSGLT